jgi:hypothetical protein
LKTWLEHQLLYSFSLDEFFPTRISHARFLTRQRVQHKWGMWCTLFSYLFSHWVLGEFLTRHTHGI